MGLWIGYDEERQTLEKFLRRPLADEIGDTNLLLIFGELGTGKSHALLWSQYYISQKMKGEFCSMSFYIRTLKKQKGVMTFQGAFQEDIIGRSNIVMDILIYKQFLDERIIEYKKDKSIGPEVSKDSILQIILKSTELLNLAKEILDCDSEDDVRDIISPKNDYEAFDLFMRLTNLFVYEFNLPSGNYRYKKAVYLFIDEMDRLGFSSLKEARDVNDLIVHLYDGCPECFGMILAATATPAELNVLFSAPVMERVDRQIQLELLQPNDAKLFTKDVLDSARIDNTKNAGYYPFAEDVIDTVVSGLVSITPRKIMKSMQRLTEEVRLADLNPANGVITTKMLDDNHIWEEIG